MWDTRVFERVICLFFAMIILVTGIYSATTGIGSGSICLKMEKNASSMVSSHSNINAQRSLLVVEENTGIKNVNGIVIHEVKNLQEKIPAKSFLFLFVCIFVSTCLVWEKAELMKAGYTNSSEKIVHYIHKKDGLKG